jgi:hypothetical protein
LSKTSGVCKCTSKESIGFYSDGISKEYFFLYLNADEKALRIVKSKIISLQKENNTIINFYINNVRKKLKITNDIFGCGKGKFTEWNKEILYRDCGKYITALKLRFLNTAHIRENEKLTSKEKTDIYRLQNHSETVVNSDYAFTPEFDFKEKQNISVIRSKLDSNIFENNEIINKKFPEVKEETIRQIKEEFKREIELENNKKIEEIKKTLKFEFEKKLENEKIRLEFQFNNKLEEYKSSEINELKNYNYFCSICNYGTKIKRDYNKHLATTKHKDSEKLSEKKNDNNEKK